MVWNADPFKANSHNAMYLRVMGNQEAWICLLLKQKAND